MQVKSKIFLLSLLIFVIPIIGKGQNDNIEERYLNGWYSTFVNLKFSERWGAHMDYHIRCNDFVLGMQQSLLRFGASVKVHPKLSFRIGYAWAENFPYGITTINSMGKKFTEHRAYESLILTDKIGIVDFTHRIMMEQRFVGRYLNPTDKQETIWPSTHRARYMLRVQVPFSKNKEAKKFFYAAASDEIMIGFGRNIGNNIFDQNRAYLFLGYQFNTWVRMELGYLNHVQMLGRKVNNRSVLQINNGLQLNTVFTFDLSKKN